MIARQGWPFIGTASALALLVQLTAGGVWALPLWLAAGILAYLFRDPDRSIPPAPLGVVSPVDGKVIAVRQGHDPYLQREALVVDLHMNRTGVYSARSPVEGKIMEIWVVRGEGRSALWVRTDEDDDVVLAIRVRGHPLRPRCYVHIGERIGQGQRCGIVGFGGEISVFLPANSRLLVSAGNRLRAGSDLLARLVH